MSTLKATNIQNAASATTNIALDTSGNVTVGNNVPVGGGITASAGTVVMSSPYTMRNKIINGAMVIDQRNAGASVTPLAPAGAYSVDRFNVVISQSSKLSFQRNAGSVTPPSGFSNYLGITSLSAYTVGASDYFAIQQSIEGYNWSEMDFGTANAKTVTLSFWVRSSLTGTFGGVIKGYDGASAIRSYPFTYTISSANTWEQKSVTIAGDTTSSTAWSSTQSKTNGYGLIVAFGLGVGATLSGAAGSWSSTNYNSATGATSVVGTNGATFYITGVQLERGTVATPFEYRNYQQELAMCQRYYWKLAPGVTSSAVASGAFYSTTVSYYSILLPVPMRAQVNTASYSAVGDFRVAYAGAVDATTAISFTGKGYQNMRLDVTSPAKTAGGATILQTGNTSAFLSFDTEL